MYNLLLLSGVTTLTSVSGPASWAIKEIYCLHAESGTMNQYSIQIDPPPLSIYAAPLMYCL